MVLRERLPYYAYDAIDTLIDAVKAGTTPSQRNALGLVGKKMARLLFRVTNYVTPLRILQVGAATGVESVVMLGVNSESRLWLYDPDLEENPVVPSVLQTQLDRIECFAEESVAIDAFLAANGEPTMTLLNKAVGEDVVSRLLDAKTVVVMANLQRNKAMDQLFDACCRHMTIGQTFTNGKIAIIIPNPKLQREDFVLWL